MSLTVPNSFTTRVENSFKQLANAAQALHSASDDLGKVIRQLDASLKKVGLGITAWVQVSGTQDETQYWSTDLGYAKIDGKWGIAVREVTGFHSDHEEDTQEYPFNDAPRALRTESVGKIPDLLEKLLQQTEETTKDLKAKTMQAAELATVISGLVPNTPPAGPQHWHKPAGALPGETSRGTELEGNGPEKSATGRFPQGEAHAAPRPPAPVRFREPEALPAERTAPTDRPLPGRPLPAERAG